MNIAIVLETLATYHVKNVYNHIVHFLDSPCLRSRSRWPLTHKNDISTWNMCVTIIQVQMKCRADCNFFVEHGCSICFIEPRLQTNILARPCMSELLQRVTTVQQWR